MNWKNLNLGKKLGIGFGALLLLIVFMLFVSYTGLSNSSQGFTEYREMARDTNLAGRLQANMLMVRMNVKEFIITGSDKDKQEYQSYLDKMSEFLAQAQTDIADPKQAEEIDLVDKDVKTYENGFEQIVTLQNHRNQLMDNTLNIKGPAIEKALSKIMFDSEANQETQNVYQSGLALRSLLLARLYVVKFLDTNDQASVDRVNKEFTDFQTQLETLNQQIIDATRKQQLTKIIQDKNEYQKAFDDLVKTILDRNLIISDTLDIIGPLVANNVEDVKLDIMATQDVLGPKLIASNTSSTRLLMIISFFSLLFGIIIAIIISRGIINPLMKSVSMSESVADGDLTKQIDLDQKDEIGQLSNALNHMSKNLGQVMSNIQGSAEQVASSSEELSTSSQSLSSAATEQASSLEETSASIEQLASSIEQNTENSNNANAIATKAAQDAQRGGEAVISTVESMKKIADQISIVDDIADQTNLLALNAAIEAARAGEMGKGFAVVAVEVRKLAERSQQAAKEITELATTSVEGANEAGKLIQQIVPDIQKTSELVEEISMACQEQSNGANQIREAITTLDQVTQQNSATSEESAAASEELAGQAQAMQEMVSQFKINSNANSYSSMQNKRASSSASSQSSIRPMVNNTVSQLPEPKKLDSQNDDTEFRSF